MLIHPSYRKGRILDIGCGTYPLFLLNTKFSEKYGLDKIMHEDFNGQFQDQKIILNNYDIEKGDLMPFESEYFNVVTMLAVFEHVEQKRLVGILREIHRILKPGGIYIMTTPAAWTDRLLKFMAKLRLVSHVELEEHKDAYTPSRIFSILQDSGFYEKKLRFGHFELFMNIWVTAIK